MTFIQVIEPESRGAAEATEYPRGCRLSQGNPGILAVLLPFAHQLEALTSIREATCQS